MRFPRFSIAGLMALTLIAALDCVGVGLMVTGLELPTNEINCMRQATSRSVHQRRQIAFAVVPMINILALVGVWGRRRPGRIGFLVAGSLAMVGAGLIATRGIDEYKLRGYQSWGDYLLINWAEPQVTAILRASFSMPPPFQKLFGFIFLASLTSGPPTAAQLGVGLLGWWFDRRFEIRRRPQGETPAVGTFVATEV